MNNPLQDHTSLFSNGKFKVDMECSNRNQPIKFRPRDLPTVESYPQYCTLIARPIKDMSDDEIREVYDQPMWSQEDCQQMREFLITRSGSGNMKLSIALKIVNKGVYPFDQSHFDDGTVIDINKENDSRYLNV